MVEMVSSSSTRSDEKSVCAAENRGVDGKASFRFEVL